MSIKPGAVPTLAQQVRQFFLLVVICVGLGVAALAGCGGVHDDYRNELQKSRAQVIGQLTTVSDVIENRTDLRVVGANGGFLSAGSAPTSSWEYAAGASTEESTEPLFFRMQKAANALRDEGWQVKSSGRTPQPYVRLTKDGVEVGLNKPALRGSTAMDFGITGPPIRTPDSADVLPQREDLDLS